MTARKIIIILLLCFLLFENSYSKLLRRLSTQEPGEAPTCANGGALPYCSRFANCIDIKDKFYCFCKEGYVGDGRYCSDEDECTSGKANCPSTGSGGYCVDYDVHTPNPTEQAYEGYKCGCDQRKGVRDGPNSNKHGPTSCVDFNECLNDEDNNCVENSDCVNFYGSYTCMCKDGFSGDGFVSCVEIEERTLPEPKIFPNPCLDTEEESIISFENFNSGAGKWINGNQSLDYQAFTPFLGPFNSSSQSPYQELNIPADVVRLFISFDIYEIKVLPDDNGILSLRLESQSRDSTTEVFFDGETGNIPGASYERSSSPLADLRSYQDFDEEFSSLIQHFLVEISSTRFSLAGDHLKAIIDFRFGSFGDGMVGVDNFRAVACIGTFPSQIPSLSPSDVPSWEPSNSGNGGANGGKNSNNNNNNNNRKPRPAKKPTTSPPTPTPSSLMNNESNEGNDAPSFVSIINAPTIGGLVSGSKGQGSSGDDNNKSPTTAPTILAVISSNAPTPAAEGQGISSDGNNSSTTAPTIPVVIPSNAPTIPAPAPSKPAPTQAPTELPTNTLTSPPSKSPTNAPTKAPTELPTKTPTSPPSKSPTDAPTSVPTKNPTGFPTELPTEPPTKAPTSTPTKLPTKSPTPEPSETLISESSSSCPDAEGGDFVTCCKRCGCLSCDYCKLCRAQNGFCTDPSGTC